MAIDISATWRETKIKQWQIYRTKVGILLPRKLNVVNKEEWEVVSFFWYNPYCKPVYDQFTIVLFWLVLLTCQHYVRRKF